jgi:hypothetical protein
MPLSMLRNIETHLHLLGAQIVERLKAEIAQKHKGTGKLLGSVSYSVTDSELTVQAYDYIFSLGNSSSTLNNEPALAGAIKTNTSMLSSAEDSFFTTTLNEAYLAQVTNGFLDGVAEDIVEDILGRFKQ